MRQLLVTIVLALLFGALVAVRLLPEQTLALRQRAAPTGAAERTGPQPAPPETGEEAVAKPAAPEAPSLPRPLRVIGLGADLLAPALLAASRRPGRFEAANLTVELAIAQTAAEIETALALGGDQPGGADIAVLPLPTLVASYERLRALDPTIFLVTGRSRGREALAAAPPLDLSKPPVASAREPLPLHAAPGSAAAFFGLAILELAGVPADSIRLVANDEPSAQASFAAVPLGGAAPAPPQRTLVSSAEATFLVHFVAVTPRGFLARNQGALVNWSAVWLAAAEEMLTDVPGSARQIAEVEGKGDPVAMVRRLGSIRQASLQDNASLAGLSGQGAVNLDQLFGWAWRLWRGAGVLSTPAPDAPSSDPAVVTALVQRAGPGGLGPIAPPRPGPQAELMTSFGPPKTATDQEIVARLGLLAGIFERSHLVLTTAAGGPKRAEALLNQAAELYGVDPARLTVGREPLEGRAFRVEVRTPR